MLAVLKNGWQPSNLSLENLTKPLSKDESGVRVLGNESSRLIRQQHFSVVKGLTDKFDLLNDDLSEIDFNDLGNELH